MNANNKKKYDQKAKKKFRDSKRWKDFRRQMYEQSGRECAVTGYKLTKLWQLHHMDMDEEHYIKANRKMPCLQAGL